MSARNFGVNEIDNHRKQIGAGRSFVGMGAADMASAIMEKVQCPAGEMPTLWQVMGHWQGPMLDTTIGQIFQPQTDILALGKNLPGTAAGSINVTQGLTNGELQTPSLICGVFVHVSPSPYFYTVPGASWGKPPAATTGTTSMPVVPDAWDAVEDTAAGGPLGLAAGNLSFLRASLNYGKWAADGMWAMMRAFNFVWSYGDKTTLLDWPLKFMAWMSPAAQLGSAGAGAVDTIEDINAMNQYYLNQGASGSIFLPRNARRTGSVTAGDAFISTFSPDDSSRLVVPTVGGIALREGLERNTEVFTLPRPVLFPRGVSLGMYLNQKDQAAFNTMTSQFSITNGLGLPSNVVPNPTVPPVYTPSTLVAPGFGTPQNSGAVPTFVEQTKDTPPLLNPLRVRSDAAIYKWGDMWIGIGAVGYEVTQGQYDAIVQNNGAIGQILANNGCPCHIL